MKYIAVYRDQEGAAFSCPVTRVGNEYKLLTHHGPREITYYIMGNDVAGGYATFQDFRLDDVPRGLRGCDYAESLNRMYKTLPWPQKSAAPSIPQTQEDFRLHVEPDTNPFRALQAAAVRATAEYETQREKQRREMLNTLNRPDPQKVEEARRINSEYATQMRPRGKGAAFIIEKEK